MAGTETADVIVLLRRDELPAITTQGVIHVASTGLLIGTARLEANQCVQAVVTEGRIVGPVKEGVDCVWHGRSFSNDTAASDSRASCVHSYSCNLL